MRAASVGHGLRAELPRLRRVLRRGFSLALHAGRSRRRSIACRRGCRCCVLKEGEFERNRKPGRPLILDPASRGDLDFATLVPARQSALGLGAYADRRRDRRRDGARPRPPRRGPDGDAGEGRVAADVAAAARVPTRPTSPSSCRPSRSAAGPGSARPSTRPVPGLAARLADRRASTRSITNGISAPASGATSRSWCGA